MGRCSVLKFCAHKKGSSTKRTSEFQSSSPRCTPKGFLRSLLTSFNAVAELQTEGAEVLGMAPGDAVESKLESKLGSNPSHIGVTFHKVAHSLKRRCVYSPVASPATLSSLCESLLAVNPKKSVATRMSVWL